MASPQTGITAAKMTDPVMGLPKQAFLVSRLEQLLSQLQSNAPGFALLLIHVGNLQAMVDGFSRLIVNEVVRTLSARLKGMVKTLPNSCLAVRIGSDQFAVISERTEKAAALKLASQIQQEIERPFAWRGNQISMRISIGIRLSMRSDTRPEEVLWDADTALSQAKKGGGTQCAVFEPGMRTRVITRLVLEGELRQAIERQEFVLHYQPKVSLRCRKLAGFEALVRWNHPRRGLVAPGEFIPAAEETGMIVRLGEWVLEEACRRMSSWRELSQTEHLSMSVNLSSQQLTQESLVDHVSACLRKHSLAAEALHLEITETSMMENADLVLKTMERLKDLRVNLWIDDFGTGHSSLGYLQRFPVSTLKIDRSFTSHMKQESALTIIRFILSLSHALGMEVVAEGIETSEQADQLEQLGCDYGQGYFFSKPVDASAAAQMILAEKFPLVNRSKSKIAQFGKCLSPNQIPTAKPLPLAG